MARILHAVLNQHRPDLGIPRESASRAFGIIPSCGTFVDLDGKGLLYTRGSVPFYGAYPGLRVPRPLLLVPHENSDTNLLTLAKDVLALTKLNWNTTQFDQKLPAPIKAAREVGRILKHVEFAAAVSPDFRRYT